jgi:hypothetical protein
VHLHLEGTDSESDSDDSDTIENLPTKRKKSPMSKLMRKLFKNGSKASSAREPGHIDTEKSGEGLPDGIVRAHTMGVADAPVQKLRTLQRYHGGPNQERMDFMEAKSPLQEQSLAVSAEQVSLFLCSGTYASSDILSAQHVGTVEFGSMRPWYSGGLVSLEELRASTEYKVF